MTEAAEVGGAVQMLKDHQAAFKLAIRAGDSGVTNAMLTIAENKLFIQLRLTQMFGILI